MSTVFLKLLNMSITASWLILAVLAARILLKKAPRWIVCLLWALVALRLLCPYSLKSVLSLVPSAETIPADIALSSQPEIHSGISVINSAVNLIINNMVNPDIAESVVPGTAAAVNPLQTIIPIISYIWAVGVAGMLVYALASYLRLRKTVAASASIKDRVLACDEIKTPFILGVIRPKIYIPSAMCGETLDCVLLHETAHLKRRDHWWKPFGFLLLAVYWFNPLCWIAYILLCRDIEAACDEKVVRDMDRDGVATYSQALLDCSFPRKRIAACPLAFGEVGVKQRIKGVLNYRRPAFWIILIAVVICITIVVCFMTDPLSIDSTARDIVQDNIQALCSEGYDVMLTVNNQIINSAHTFIGYDEEFKCTYAQLPFLAIIRQLGGQITYKYDGNIDIELNGVDYILDPINYSLKEKTGGGNMIAPPPNSSTKGSYQYFTDEKEIVIGNYELKYFFSRIGVVVSIDSESKKIDIVWKS